MGPPTEPGESHSEREHQYETDDDRGCVVQARHIAGAGERSVDLSHGPLEGSAEEVALPVLGAQQLSPQLCPRFVGSQVGRVDQRRGGDWRHGAVAPAPDLVSSSTSNASLRILTSM